MENRLFDLLLLSIAKLFQISGFFIGCHILAFPTWHVYPTSLKLSWNILYYILPLCNFWLVITIMVLMWFVVVYILTTAVYMWHLLPEFIEESGNQLNYTSSLFRESINVQCYLRELQILHKCFELTFTILIIPATILFTNMILFCNYSLIKHWKDMDRVNALVLMIWSVLETIGWSGIFQVLGKLRQRSCKVLAALKRKSYSSRTEELAMSKFLKSCQPFSYGYGGMCVIKTSSVLTFLRGATRATFRTLLAF